jgi:hypothetical protein
VQISKVDSKFSVLTRKEREEDDCELTSMEQNNVVTVTFQSIPADTRDLDDQALLVAPKVRPQSIGKRGKSAGLADAVR